MNNLINRVISHQKTRSDNSLHSNNKQAASSKLKPLYPHRNTKSRQIQSFLGALDIKSIDLFNLRHYLNKKDKPKKVTTSTNTRQRNRKMSSRSFDKLFLIKPKEKMYEKIMKELATTNHNGIHIKHDWKKKDEGNDKRMLTQQSSNLKSSPISFLVFPGFNKTNLVDGSNQKAFMLKSPLIKKKMEIKVNLPINSNEQLVNKSNNDVFDEQVYGVKKRIKVYHTKIYDTFSIKKSNAQPLLTQQSENRGRPNNATENTRELSPTFSERKTDQSISFKANESRVVIPHPETESKHKSRLKLEMKEETHGSLRRSEIPLKTDVSQRPSSQISALYQDIIRNNIRFSQKQNNQLQLLTQENSCRDNSLINNNRKDADAYISNTPQLTKYSECHPQTHTKENITNNKELILKDNNETIIDKTCHIPIFFPNSRMNNKGSLNTSSRLKTEIFHMQHPVKDLRINTEGDIVPSNDEIDTDDQFDEDNNIGSNERKGIPSFSSKHLTTYNCFSEGGGISDLEVLSKTKSIFPLVLSFMNYESLAMLCQCNSSLRKRLKGIQYQWTAFFVFDPKQTDIKKRIRKSVWRSSSLSKDLSTVRQIYFDHLYQVSPYDEEIKKDLSRTFPEDESFKQGHYNYMKLYHILSAYSNYHKVIGYAQGLNFLVANALFLFDKEYEVFIFVDGLINKFHLEQLIGLGNILRAKLEEMGRLLRKCASKVMKYLDHIGLGHEFFTANWLLTLFSNSMRKRYLFYVWDFMIIYGKQFLYYFIAAIVIKYSNKIIDYDQSLLSHLMKGLLKSDDFEKDFRSIIGNAFELMRIYCI